MNEPTYKSALTTLADGITQLTKCLCRTSRATALDLFQGVKCHPILACAVLLSYVTMFFAMANARAERDNLSQKVYHYEISNDSLKMLVNYD